MVICCDTIEDGFINIIVDDIDNLGSKITDYDRETQDKIFLFIKKYRDDMFFFEFVSYEFGYGDTCKSILKKYGVKINMEGFTC